MGSAAQFIVLIHTFIGTDEVKTGTILSPLQIETLGEDQQKLLLEQGIIRKTTKDDFAEHVDSTDLGHDVVAAAKEAGDLTDGEAAEVDLDIEEKKKPKGKK